MLFVRNNYSNFSSTYKFCPGLEVSEYEEYKRNIHFDIKSVRKLTEPFLRIESISCQIWYELGKSSSIKKREAESVLCQHCVRLKCNLSHQAKRTQQESPSSHARLLYMSPFSQQKRKQSIKIERDNAARKIRKYEHTRMRLDEEQDEEMNRVVTTIEKECEDELQKLFTEGEKHGVGQQLREVWMNDKQADCVQFKKDQSQNS